MGQENGEDPTLKEWSEHEEQTETAKLRAELTRLKNKPKKSCMHRLFNLISFLMGTTALLMTTGQLAGLYLYEVDPLEGVVRCYVVLMCFVILLNELEWTKFIRDSAILHIWITRGIFYSFVGVLGLEENDTTTADSEHSAMIGHDQAMNFILVVAYMMVACGVLYFGMGCLCLQLVRNRVMADYEQRSTEATTDQKRPKEGSVV